MLSITVFIQFSKEQFYVTTKDSHNNEELHCLFRAVCKFSFLFALKKNKNKNNPPQASVFYLFFTNIELY